MKHIIKLTIMGVLLCSCGTMTPKKTSTENDVIPQAKPVISYFMAVRNNDIATFKGTLCAEAKSQFDSEQQWVDYFSKWRKGVRQDVYDEDFNPMNLDYEYTGDAISGCVVCTGPNGSKGIFDVIKENGYWLLK